MAVIGLTRSMLGWTLSEQEGDQTHIWVMHKLPFSSCYLSKVEGWTIQLQFICPTRLDHSLANNIHTDSEHVCLLSFFPLLSLHVSEMEPWSGANLRSHLWNWLHIWLNTPSYGDNVAVVVKRAGRFGRAPLFCMGHKAQRSTLIRGLFCFAFSSTCCISRAAEAPGRPRVA